MPTFFKVLIHICEFIQLSPPAPLFHLSFECEFRVCIECNPLHIMCREIMAKCLSNESSSQASVIHVSTLTSRLVLVI